MKSILQSTQSSLQSTRAILQSTQAVDCYYPAEPEAQRSLLLVEVRRDEGAPLRKAESTKVETSKIAYAVFKRSFDVLGSLLILASVWPSMLLIAAIIGLKYGRPIIFRQKRLTQGGREFIIYKFRTMASNAEAITGVVWADQNDPRVTRFGRILRSTRFDELPQLYNVLRGDMSLIGPRPERPEFASRLALELPSFDKRLEVKAGLTGLAQVANGYANCLQSYRKKLAWDRLYIQRQSISLDLLIAFKTVWVMLTGRGAH